MNYISQINGFWKIAEDKQFSSSEIATYFALLNYCNNLNWLNPFVCHFEYVCQTASISKNTFYACMETLHNEKLIEYTKGIKNSKKPKVFILNLENKTKNKTGTKLRTEEEQNKEQKGNLNKLLNNETNKPINNIQERKLKFSSSLQPFLNKYGKDLLNNFYKYWTEENKSGTKFKQELEQTWNLERRLETWSANELKFSGAQTKPAEVKTTSLSFATNKPKNG
jgi:hypothetical protein